MRISVTFCFRIPRLLEVVMGSALSFPRIVSCLAKCFYRISVTFGKTFVDKKVGEHTIKFNMFLCFGIDRLGAILFLIRPSVCPCVCPQKLLRWP